MFTIRKDGRVVATMDHLQFVRRQANGLMVNCPEGDAQGICVGNDFYHLPWMPLLTGAREATVEAFDGEAAIAQLDEAVIDLTYQNTLLELEVE